MTAYLVRVSRAWSEVLRGRQLLTGLFFVFVIEQGGHELGPAPRVSVQSWRVDLVEKREFNSGSLRPEEY